MGRAPAGTLLLVTSLGAATAADAGVYKTQSQALAEAFPGGHQRKTSFLTEEQAREAERRARASLESRIVSYYVGWAASREPAGVAFFDTHTVRTATETVLVLIGPDRRVRKVEILAFHEPEDYKVRQGWVDRLRDKSLGDDLAPGRDLVRVTGATLSVHALAAAVRRALALHAVLMGDDAS